MSFSSTITITGSTNITNFDIYQCPTSGCTGCVAITGSTGENVSRTKLLTGHTVNVDQGFRYIKLVADTQTCNNSICMEVTGIPTFTLTPTPTGTAIPTSTPTPTATNTPISTNTPIPTSTPIPEATPTPTPTSTPIPEATPTPTPTSTPTPTPTPTTTLGNCYTMTYSTVPADLYVRYRKNSTDTIVTELINSLISMDNGNGTYTAYICVKQGGSYAIPTCVQGGVEVTCDPYIWMQDGNCDMEDMCLSVPTSEWYKIENCWNGTTGYTDSFEVNTFELNDRLVTYLDPSKIWKVIEILTENPGGIKENVVATTPVATGCPIQYTYYYGSPKQAVDGGFPDYCTTPGYVMTGTLKTSAETISNITPGSSVIYNSDGSTFVGLGSDYYYPISATYGDNTFELFVFKYIKIDTNGSVLDSGNINCSGGGGSNPF